MDKLIITGKKSLIGSTPVSGAKNVALKMLVAACLTEEEVVIENIPLISDLFIMIDIIKDLGGEIFIKDHTAYIKAGSLKKTEISLDQASHIRTSSMFLAPLLAKYKHAVIPNPGGCRIGARPIDRTIEGLEKMGAEIIYKSEDGYFHAQTNQLQGMEYKFDKNTHTGTETLIIAASLAKGKTVLENAAAEPEVDELIDMINSMGGKIKRVSERRIEIEGVDKLHGTRVFIKPDRNEIVTFAIAAYVTKGDIFIKGARRFGLETFLSKLVEVGAGFEEKNDGIRFFYQGQIKAANVETKPHPGFMTDWQAPWAILMTQAVGESIIHETVFENRFGYVNELRKMGAKIKKFYPLVENPHEVYNFDFSSDGQDSFHAVKIFGPTSLHDAVVSISDLRAGASLVLAALAASGETTIHGVHIIDRGYENFAERLKNLGANIERKKDDYV